MLPLSLHTHQKLYNCNKYKNKNFDHNLASPEMKFIFSAEKKGLMQKIENTYTVFEAPFPRISLYCNHNIITIHNSNSRNTRFAFTKNKKYKKISRNQKELKTLKKLKHTLPYLPVGSTSTNSESSESRSTTPFIPYTYLYADIEREREREREIQIKNQEKGSTVTKDAMLLKSRFSKNY